MAEYSKIFKKIWKNKKYRSLKDSQKLLWLYLLSSPHANVLGFYCLPKAYISSDMGWSSQKTAQNLAVLSKALIKYDEENQIILISSWFEHNPLSSENHIKKAQAELSEVPETPLYQEFIEIIEKLPDGYEKHIIDKSVGTAFERRLNSEEEEETEKETEAKTANIEPQNLRKNNSNSGVNVNDFTDSSEPLSKKIKKCEIDEKTIAKVRDRLGIRLFKLNYLKSECDVKRLDNFISKLLKEAAKKKNPPGWFIKVAERRLNENLEDFRPTRDEVDNIAISSDLLKCK